MDILLFFQNLRNPVFNMIFNIFTFFGEETFIILLVCFFAWCMNKRLAHYMGFTFTFSMMLNQALKITFCVPRPWLRYNITPYEGALEKATGYSFPSGHAQTSATIYPAIADYFRNKWLYIITILFAVCVAVSRMYYGVHTVYDVTVGFALGLICVFTVGRMVNRNYHRTNTLAVLGIAITVLFLLYAALKKYPENADMDLINDCFKQAGLMAGFIISWFLERKYLDYSVKAPVRVQIIKFIVGVVVLLLLKITLDNFAQGNIMYFMEYFILIFWCVYLYPAIFTKFIKRGV